MNNSHEFDRGDIVQELRNFGKMVSGEYPGYLDNIVTTSSSMGMLISCSLYILAPAVPYEYKVIDIEIDSVKEATVRFITLATGQMEPYNVDISTGTADITRTLLKIKSLQLFRAAMEALIHRVNLKREFKEEIAGRIVPGQAKVAVLKNGDRINVGWIEVKDKKVWYYTGKGLRELWRPGMIGEELRTAEKLRALTIDEKIALDYVEVRNLSDFEEIL